jgi:hypothetical protein
MKFFDLRLKFEPVNGNQWTVYITGPSVIKRPRKAKVDFTLPFSVEHLCHWRGKIKDSVEGCNGADLRVYRAGVPGNVEYISEEDVRGQRGNMCSQVVGPFDLTKALGKDLFTALFQASTSQPYEIYRRSRDRAVQQGKGLRIWLILPRDNILTLVPFEYLCDPWDASGECLAKRTDISISMVRAVRVQKRPRGTPQGLLRLWYISASPQLLSPINDLDIISDACWETGLKVIPHPILKASTEKLIMLLGRLGADSRYSPTIIHVSAHGESNRIFLEKGNGQPHPVLVPDLASRLASAKELRLVVFSVCDTDNPIDCAMDLCHQGVAGVVMQFPVTQDAVRGFQRAFYTNYLHDYDLDHAIAEGRRQIALCTGNTIEWGAPVVIEPEFPSPPFPMRIWRWLTSVTGLFARALVPRWIIIFLIVLALSLAAMVAYKFMQPPVLTSTIKQVVVYTGEAVFRAPDEGRLFPVFIKGEGGTVPIEVFATRENQPLDFTCTVIGAGKVERRNANEHQAQFEYIPPPNSTAATLEFCIYEKTRKAMRSCMATVLDIIVIH